MSPVLKIEREVKHHFKLEGKDFSIFILKMLIVMSIVAVRDKITQKARAKMNMFLYRYIV